MKYCITILVAFSFLIEKVKGQSDLKVDTTLLLTKNWLQSNSTQSSLHKILNTPSKLVLLKSKKWGNEYNYENQKKRLFMGSWKFEDSFLIIYDPHLHMFGYKCTITKLTDQELIIKYKNFSKPYREIKIVFKPISQYIAAAEE